MKSGKSENISISCIWEHVKNLAFLAGHSAKALHDPPPKPVSGTIAIYAFFLCKDIYMFFKQANSDMDNGFEKKIKNIPFHIQRELEKTLF